MRVWIGLGVTAFFLWVSFRDVDFAQLWKLIAGADWLVLFGLSVPCYGLLVWERGVRWRHLTDPIQKMENAALARAVSVGAMANNVFPLRMGEVVRSWYLARETGVSTAAIFGTVILERVVDTVSVIVLALLVIGIWGSGGDGLLERGALLLVPVAVLPILFLVLLSRAPSRVIGWVQLLLRPFPERFSSFTERMLHRFSEGLGALRGGRHLVWIGVHSASIWLVVSAIPVVAAFLALDIEFATPLEMVGAAWTTQAAVGVAIALPSAPGFFGIFHAACIFALVRFDVDRETAVAAGTLIHAVMWLTLTGLGFAVLRLRRTSLGELDRVAGAPPSE